LIARPDSLRSKDVDDTDDERQINASITPPTAGSTTSMTRLSNAR
jgi:hypothetical protein